MWLLMQSESTSSSFHELTLDLWTLLEILPQKELNLSEDVCELRDFAIKQCRKDKSSFIDPIDNGLMIKVLNMLYSIRREIVPDHSRLAEIFAELGLGDSVSCREEIECLEDEIQCQSDEKSKSEVIALIGLVRYAKCVLFGASSPGSDERIHRTMSDLNIPADFRCPITLDLMMDPVVVATGQTYDRSSITLWIESGHNTCPKTGQGLAHANLIPNRALKSLIATWCQEHRIPFAVGVEGSEGQNGVVSNKTALEVTKMMVSFLMSKLVSPLQSLETINRVVYELRVLAKTGSDNRECIGEAGTIVLLVSYLGSENPTLQVNTVTTILNLSILEGNKTRIMETDSVLNGIIEVLRSGVTWEAKGNAAATIFSLSTVSAYRKRLGKKTRVAKGLVELAREGPISTKKDALVAILAFAADRETTGKLVENGVVDMLNEIMDELSEEAMTILETVVKKGGFMAIAATSHMIGKLVVMLRSGTDRTKENVIATLVIICRKGGAEMVSELAKITTMEMVIWELMGTGTARAKRKAASLMRILRRWAAGLEGDVLEEFSMTTTRL